MRRGGWPRSQNSRATARTVISASTGNRWQIYPIHLVCRGLSLIARYLRGIATSSPSRPCSIVISGKKPGLTLAQSAASHSSPLLLLYIIQTPHIPLCAHDVHCGTSKFVAPFASPRRHARTLLSPAGIGRSASSYGVPCQLSNEEEHPPGPTRLVQVAGEPPHER